MPDRENRVTAHIREQLRSAHWLLVETVSDVTGEISAAKGLQGKKGYPV